MSLKDRTISSIFWSLLQKVGGKGISVLITILLARILTPKDFGFIAMLSIFIAVSQALINGGFGQALIQKKNTDDNDFSTIFYLNLGVSIVLYGILYVSAPYIAAFYSQPLLTKLTRVLTLIFLITPFSLVQNARLKKAMRFKTLTVIHIPSIIISGGVALTMAYLNYGVWALVALQLSMRFVYTLQLWIYSKWIPKWTFHREKSKELFSFGGNLMIISLLNKIYANLYLIIIGKFFSAEMLGYFKNADSLERAPSATISSAVKSVTFSAFSEIQDDNTRLKQGYKKAIQQLFFCVCPVIMIAAILATPLFRFVLTDKWLPAVPFFQLMCIVGIMRPLNSFNLDIVKVKGRTDLSLKINIANKIGQTIGIAATLPFGIWPLVSFYSFFSVVRFFINGHYSGRFINYPVREQIKDISHNIVLSIFVGAIIWYLNTYIIIQWTDFYRIAAGFTIGIGLYWLGAHLWKLEAYTYLTSIMANLIKKKTNFRHL
jgi:O-antigen/teichoic acid export membrane protein